MQSLCNNNKLNRIYSLLHRFIGITKRTFIYYRLNPRKFGSFIVLFLLSLLIYAKIKFSHPYYEPLSTITEEPNCSDLFNEKTDPTIFKTAESWTVPSNETFTDSELNEKISRDCHGFLSEKKYFLTIPYRSEETNFPIAYSILVYKSASQFERLLRTIYRPWNYYCVHIDLKSTENFVGAVGQLVNCLNSLHQNIVNTDNRVDVQWGEMTVLSADLNCMRELHEKFSDWKYLINLTGQEFPLKTNWELVTIFKAFKGANNVDGTYTRRDEIRVPDVNLPFAVSSFDVFRGGGMV